jgi:hypothetical protein
MGDTAVGAVTFSVDPSGAAGEPASADVALGETGVSDCFEQATAAARTAAQVQSTNLFWNIHYLAMRFGITRWEGGVAK